MSIKYNWSSGKRFNSLLLTGKSLLVNGKRKVETICKCENIKWINWQDIKNGSAISCGCFKKNHLWEESKKHGLTNHSLYVVWDKMKQRCYNPNDPKYPLYGGSGVAICEEWKTDFMAFYNWAMSNGWVKGLEIDKDKLSPSQTGKLYSPEFCCFVSHKENCNHTRRTRIIEYNGESKSLSEWCEQLNLGRRTTHRRIYKFGWAVEMAFNPPTNYSRR